MILKYNQFLNEVNIFTNQKTGISYFDDMLKNPEYFEKSKDITFEIKYMSPSDYLKICKKHQKQFLIDDAVVAKIKSLMSSGNTFPMLVIEYTYQNNKTSFSQEGRYRAIAAKELAVNKIPVMEVKRNWNY